MAKPVPPKPPDETLATFANVQLRRIAEALETLNDHAACANQHLECICKALQPPKLTDWKLRQLNDLGGITMAGEIIGVRVGGRAAFEILPVPGNAAVGSGPTATSDTTGVTVGPNPNDPGNPYMIEIAVADGVTDTSLDLKVDGTDDTGGAVTHTFTIPIQAGPAPKLVDWDLAQLVATPVRAAARKR